MTRPKSPLAVAFRTKEENMPKPLQFAVGGPTASWYVRVYSSTKSVHLHRTAPAAGEYEPCPHQSGVFFSWPHSSFSPFSPPLPFQSFPFNFPPRCYREGYDRPRALKRSDAEDPSEAVRGSSIRPPKYLLPGTVNPVFLCFRTIFFRLPVRLTMLWHRRRAPNLPLFF